MAGRKNVLWINFSIFLGLALALAVILTEGWNLLDAVMGGIALVAAGSGVTYYAIKIFRHQVAKQSQTILASSPTAILCFTSGGRLDYLNLKAEKYLGFPLAEGRGKNYQEIIERFLGQAGMEMVRKQFQQVGATGKASEPVEVLLNTGGETFSLELTARPVKPDSPGEGIILSLRDVSFRREFEVRMRRLETLSVVGQLAAGVAHEIRNPLTAVRGFGQLLFQKLEGKEKEYAGIMLKELDRASNILQDFLQLARPTRPEFSRCDLHLLLDEAIQLVATQAYFKGITIHKHYDEGLPNLPLDSKQMKQVFLNFLGNSLAALEAEGDILIRTALDRQEQEVIIEIQDTGVGMDEVTLAKLGQPFFTTKENGTGLGLCISYQIIREHGGQVTATSSPGKGTTFIISLPYQEDMAGVGPKAPTA